MEKEGERERDVEALHSSSSSVWPRNSSGADNATSESARKLEKKRKNLQSLLKKQFARLVGIASCKFL